MINSYIKAQRESLSLSQEYMAKELEISRPTYIAIEKGRKEISISTAEKIADIFGLSLIDLLNETSQESSVDIVGLDEVEDSESGIRISIPKKDIDKFREVLLYVLTKVGAKPHVGETVLNKLLYFIDFDYYEKFEEQLIGATYIKNHYGPTPVELKILIDDMKAKGEIEQVKSKYFKHMQKKYLAVREPNLAKLLSAQELKHIDDVLARLSDKNATELSNYSHEDIPWITADEGKPLDYESVFYRTTKTSVRNY